MPFKTEPDSYASLLIAAIGVWSACVGVTSSALGQGAGITELPARFVEPTYYDEVVFSPDGKHLVLVNHDGGLAKLCDMTSGKAEALANPYGHTSRGTSVAYSGDGRLLAIAYEDRGIVVWNIDERKELSRIVLTALAVRGMVFIDGQRNLSAVSVSRPRNALEILMTKPGDVLAVRWDISSGKQRRTADFGPDRMFVALSADGRHAVFENKLLEPAVFDLITGAKAFDLKLGGSWVFTRDGSALVACEKNRLSLRAVPSGKELKHYDVTDEFILGSELLPSVSSDGKLLAVPSYPSGNVASVISLYTGKIVGQVECGPRLTICHFARLSPDGRTLATQTGAINAEDKPVEPALKLWRLPALR